VPKFLKNIPFYPFLLAIFPILSLLGNNIQEVDPRVALRSTAISLGATLLVFLAARLILRSWPRAALLSSFLLVLFFSYGHLYHALREIPSLGLQLARHRYFIPAYALMALLGIFWIVWKVKQPANPTLALNLAAILLLVFPAYQVTGALLRTSIATEQQTAALSAGELPIQSPQGMPDVYFIVLDMHTRSDALQQDFGHDNSDFINGLRELGFYVADCSRSNYPETSQSLISALNMDYVSTLSQQMADQGRDPNDITVLIKQSLVRYQLEAVGYQTYAFESEYEWSRLTDAYHYLRSTEAPYTLLQPFEAMLIQSTALLIWADTTYQAATETSDNPFHGINASLENHVNQQLFILDYLPGLATVNEPKFVFAHIIVPHIPFVFEADGSIVSDPGFYSGRLSEPIDREHLLQGYVNQVTFIDTRILEVVRQILQDSAEPPIIVIMGDHGLEADNRLAILNAIYLPGEGSQHLYPSITPVNTFRVIFNTYFGANYPLLPDLSYNAESALAVETYPTCIQP